MTTHAEPASTLPALRYKDDASAYVRAAEDGFFERVVSISTSHSGTEVTSLLQGMLHQSRFGHSQSNGASHRGLMWCQRGVARQRPKTHPILCLLLASRAEQTERQGEGKCFLRRPRQAVQRTWVPTRACGHCIWLWRFGHKEPQCWFKQRYLQSLPAAGSSTARYARVDTWTNQRQGQGQRERACPEQQETSGQNRNATNRERQRVGLVVGRIRREHHAPLSRDLSSRQALTLSFSSYGHDSVSNR